jgi:hypothetical protein
VADSEVIMKLCKDCKHHSQYITDNPIKMPRGNGRYNKCHRKPPSINKIDGSLIDNYSYCDTERAIPFPFNYIFMECGSSARYFKAK